MNEQEAAAWGRLENALRLRDMAGITSQAGVMVAQKRAYKRRTLAGLTPNEAASLVREAQAAEDRMIRNLTPEDYVASDKAARTLVQEGVCVYYAGKADLLSAVLRRQGEVTRHAVGDSLLGITYRLEPLE